MDKIKVWYDSEADYLEVIFKQDFGYFRETAHDCIMEKVDMQGNPLGFSIMNVSKLKPRPLFFSLPVVVKKEESWVVSADE